MSHRDIDVRIDSVVVEGGVETGGVDAVTDLSRRIVDAINEHPSSPDLADRLDTIAAAAAQAISERV